MVSMLKEFLLKKMLKSQMKGVPEAEQEKMMKLISENPELFQKIALEVQEKVKGGQDQMSAMMEVMPKYQEDLKKIL
jgi:2-oxo-4-hydroxy-4-carboxy--5-ureidoimidazoline (OHCU) decarboxylase